MLKVVKRTSMLHYFGEIEQRIIDLGGRKKPTFVISDAIWITSKSLMKPTHIYFFQSTPLSYLGFGEIISETNYQIQGLREEQDAGFKPQLKTQVFFTYTPQMRAILILYQTKNGEILLPEGISVGRGDERLEKRIREYLPNF